MNIEGKKNQYKKQQIDTEGNKISVKQKQDNGYRRKIKNYKRRKFTQNETTLV